MVENLSIKSDLQNTPLKNVRSFKLEVPVLYIVFNRFDLVKKTFPKIKQQRPKQLFIASDGPRNKNEKRKVDEIRSYLQKSVDWHCTLKTLFREKNLGCGQGPADAINWFFKNVDEGIILEDDCLPNKSFFIFCQEMLKTYKDNLDIMQISGTNFLKFNALEETYFFSKYGSIWGWATWRRAWENFDYSLSKFKKFKAIKFKGELRFFDRLLKKTYFIIIKKGLIKGVWDYQWNLTRSIYGRFNITPVFNLVENIGFGENATHTTKKINILKTKEIKFPLKKPKNIYLNKTYDTLFYRKRIIKNSIKNSIKIPFQLIKITLKSVK